MDFYIFCSIFWDILMISYWRHLSFFILQPSKIRKLGIKTGEVSRIVCLKRKNKWFTIFFLTSSFCFHLPIFLFIIPMELKIIPLFFCFPPPKKNNRFNPQLKNVWLASMFESTIRESKLYRNWRFFYTRQPRIPKSKESHQIDDLEDPKVPRGSPVMERYRSLLFFPNLFFLLD